MIKIIYTLSVLILFILAILVEKKKEKIDIITSFFVGIMILFCFNIIECLVVSVFFKSVTLLPLTIINYSISALLIYKIIKSKKIQKFYIKIKDIFAVLIITVIAVTVLIITFGIPFKISFICTDAANHYEMITDFYQTGEIGIETIPGAYINYGLAFKVFYDINNKLTGYNIFMILEIIKFVFSGVLFYLTIKKFIKTKFSYFISILLSLIYILAYPLNGVLSGFVYFQISINIIGTIFIIMMYHNDINNKLKNSLLFLLTFGLMFTYYILVPPVYIAIFLYELREFKKSKLTSILNILKIFLIPSVLGILFFVILPNMGLSKREYIGLQMMAWDGYIFTNYYTSFIFFIPFSIYYIIVNIKKKKIDFIGLMLIFNILYIVLAIILKENNIISRYYVMKPYYALWLIMLTITTITILNVLSSKVQRAYKFISVIPIIVYVILIIVFIGIKGPTGIRVFENKTEDITSIFDVYRINLGVMLNKTFEVTYFSDELEVINEIGSFLDNDTRIYYQESEICRMWFKNLLLIKKYDSINKGEIYLDNDAQNEIITGIKDTKDTIYIVVHNGRFTELLYKDFAKKIDENFNIVAQKNRITIYTNK